MSAASNANNRDETAAWHAVAADEAIGRLHTDPIEGLDAARRLGAFPNTAPTACRTGSSEGHLMRFLAQLNNILVYVLLAAGFVKLMVGLWLDAAVILGVVILNALLGFIQEGKAEKALDSIRNMLSAEAERCAAARPA